MPPDCIRKRKKTSDGSFSTGSKRHPAKTGRFAGGSAWIDRIHTDALVVLEETGVRCQNEDVRRIFEETGLAANDETTGHIHVLPALVAQALTTVPKRQDFFVPENASESVEAFAELRRLGSRLPRLVIISQEERIRQAREKILFNFSVSELLVLRSQFGAPIADLHLPFALNAVGAALAAIWKKPPME